ncbi:MAG: phosphoglycerate dehydrogenase [Anaerolineales bacterium]
MAEHPLKSMRLLVTPTSFGRDDPSLCTSLEAEVGQVVYNNSGKPLDSAALAALLPGIDGYIAGLDQIDRSALQAADRLKVISRYGVGVDAVDLQAAREKGIQITNTPGANSSSVAELAVGLMLALARNIPSAVAATQAGGWPRLPGISLEGKVIGLVGFGSIGRCVARRLSGFECTLLAYDPLIDPTQAYDLGVTLTTLQEIVPVADFISLHCPLTPETRRMVDAHFLAAMKAGAYLINTARGELVDEAALLLALESAKLGGAALDVFSDQPPGKDNPLLAQPRLIATPHMGAHTDAATNTMGWMALHDCLAVLRGEQPRYRVA